MKHWVYPLKMHVRKGYGRRRRHAQFLLAAITDVTFRTGALVRGATGASIGAWRDAFGDA